MFEFFFQCMNKNAEYLSQVEFAGVQNGTLIVIYQIHAIRLGQYNFFFKLTVNIYFKSSPLFVPCKGSTETWQRDITAV